MTIHRVVLLITATAIFSMGLLMIFSTTSADILDHAAGKNTHIALIKQIAYALGGCVLVAIVWNVGYRKLLALSPLLLFIFTLLLLLTLIPGIGRVVNGSRRWISIAGFSFQPSEFVKMILPAFMIHHYLSFKGQVFTFKDFMKLMLIAAIPIGLIMVEPNNGTSAVIALTVLVLIFLMGISVRYWALPLAVFITIGGLFAYNLPYVNARLQVYLHPELDLKGKGHQPYQAKIAAGSGGLFGKGPGNSLQKLSYLPEAQNDYIAAIYAEEFGFLGMLTLMILYMTFAYVGYAIACGAQDKEGFYLGGALTFLICFQAFLNLGVVSGLLPSTGLNLPLFSQGGTSLMANMVGVTLLMNIEQK